MPTVLRLLGMTQAINFIDGLDGLAAGIVAIASGTFFVYSLELANDDSAIAVASRSASRKKATAS